jgi:hypothetical protein
VRQKRCARKRPRISPELPFRLCSDPLVACCHQPPVDTEVPAIVQEKVVPKLMFRSGCSVMAAPYSTVSAAWSLFAVDPAHQRSLRGLLWLGVCRNR